MHEIVIIHIILSLLVLPNSGQLNDASQNGHRVLNYSQQNPELRIIDGVGASLYEYTFMAVLVKYNQSKKYKQSRVEDSKGQLACGGAIIHKDWILTAARCFDDGTNMENFEIYAGIVNLRNEVGQQIRNIKHISKHPNYKTSSDEFNIAMVEVSASFLVTAHVSAGYLPVNPLRITGTERCHILGFVREYSSENDDSEFEERLLKVQLHAINYQECLDRIKVLKALNPHGVSNKNYCLVQIEEYPSNNSQGACEGDVGGPCICGFKIQGIIGSHTNETCFKVGYPTTVVDVGHHLNWIRANILRLNVLPRNVAKQIANNNKCLLPELFCFIFLLIKGII